MLKKLKRKLVIPALYLRLFLVQCISQSAARDQSTSRGGKTNARLCKKARLPFLLARSRHLDFFKIAKSKLKQTNRDVETFFNFAENCDSETTL